MTTVTQEQKKIIAVHYKNTGDTEFRPKDLVEIADDLNYARAEVYRLMKICPKVSHGVYNFADFIKLTQVTQEVHEPVNETVFSQVSLVQSDMIRVPNVLKHFEAWGNYDMVYKIVETQSFFPTFITGLSGNGKTLMVDQVCANLGREYVFFQVSPETDEEDLIGGFRLINGQTVFQKGPVIEAMERGAVLILDEVDRGANKLLCLQGVLEGRSILLKKTGETVTPKPGFNIIGTANTKGRGSISGMFTGVTIMDEAFLERWAITIEQGYAPKLTEKKILQKHFMLYKHKKNEMAFINHLIEWANTIRTTYFAGGIDNFISTRRLCNIVQTYTIFGDYRKAVELCVARFEEDTKVSFLDLFDKTSKGSKQDPAPSAVSQEPTITV